MWPVSRGCLLLRGTWSYLCICWGSVLPTLDFEIAFMIAIACVLHIVNFAILYFNNVDFMHNPFRWMWRKTLQETFLFHVIYVEFIGSSVYLRIQFLARIRFNVTYISRIDMHSHSWKYYSFYLCSLYLQVCRPMFGAQSLRAGRDLYCTAPVVTRDLGLLGIIRRTAHSVKSYDTQGDVENLFESGSPHLPIQSPLTTHKGILRTYSYAGFYRSFRVWRWLMSNKYFYFWTFSMHIIYQGHTNNLRNGIFWRTRCLQRSRWKIIF
jgi:hypothetical protein